MNVRTHTHASTHMQTNKQANKLYGSQEYMNILKLDMPPFGHNCLLLSDMF